ncbi:hypothetical protein BSR29_01030 [Boudabousia liubingyangii]|uniref:Uncharacterized protein n=1 Tax=Boudabousia liubingyangii TaxID=1921764 RepID=A0A1Q5PPY2_9ACTO|nr:DUF2516 family protein [Boudabousia liubingyangii]OKL48402.1 hypothetical protein BSR28_01490 [Boudabousia liubingyangii]OKL49572.1 hypothetical protein BSR29_01030 [Boudabousia liubingyangii]
MSLPYVLNLIMAVVNLSLTLLLPVLFLWAAIHASLTPARAFTAFASLNKNAWLIILWLGVVLSFGQGVWATRALLALFGVYLNLPVWLPGATGLLSGGAWGVIFLAIPGVYLAGDRNRVNEFRALQKGRGQYRQRPGGEPRQRGPRDW